MSPGLAGLIGLVGLEVLTLGASSLAYRSWRQYATRARGAPGRALARAQPPTPLDQLFDGPEAVHPSDSGLAGLFDNPDAFAARHSGGGEPGCQGSSAAG